MHRRELLLVTLATAKGRPFQPAQIQKALFLVSTNLPQLTDPDESYNFLPYNYGPFDHNVYADAEDLQTEGAAVIAPSANGRWRTYAASEAGLVRGERLLATLDRDSRTYIDDVVRWVLAQSFGSLVKSIYEAYPEMKENSIFQG